MSYKSTKDGAMILRNAIEKSWLNGVVRDEDRDTFYDYFMFILCENNPDTLRGIEHLDDYIRKLSNHNYEDSNWKFVVLTLESFLRKVLYLVDPVKYGEVTAIDSATGKASIRGLKDLIYTMKIYTVYDSNGVRSNNPYFVDEVSQNEIVKWKEVADERNNNGHECPTFDIVKTQKLIKDVILVEMAAIEKYKNRIKNIYESYYSDASNERFNSLINSVLKKYIDYQIDEYDKEIQYIQTRLELDKLNANDNDDDNDSNDNKSTGAYELTANTLLDTINLGKSKNIKLSAEAGMGKTMLIKYLNYKYLDELKDLLDKDVSIKKKILPIAIFCYELNSSDLTVQNCGEFKKLAFDRIFKHLEDRDSYPENEIKSMIKIIEDNYSVLYLIDGLNEIVDNQKKNLFVKSIENNIQKTSNNNRYFIITERRHKKANTVKVNIETYKFSELTDDIVKEFFAARGHENLLERLESMQMNLSSSDREKVTKILKRPFFINVYCDCCDEEDFNELPKSSYEIMDMFVNKLLERETTKPEAENTTADPNALFSYIKMLTAIVNNVPADETTDDTMLTLCLTVGFGIVSQKYGYTDVYYSTDRIISMFEQFGFINRIGTDKFYISNDNFKDYLSEMAYDDNREKEIDLMSEWIGKELHWYE